MIEILGLLAGWIVTTIVGVIKLSSMFKDYIEKNTTKDVVQKKDIQILQDDVSSTNSLIRALTDKIDNLKSSLIAMEKDIYQLQKDSQKIEKKIEVLSEEIILLKTKK